MMGKENFPSVRSSQKLLFSAYFWRRQGVDNKCKLGNYPFFPLFEAGPACLRGLKVAVVITDLEVETQTVQEWVEIAAEENQSVPLVRSTRVRWSQGISQGVVAEELHEVHSQAKQTTSFCSGQYTL